MIAKAARMRLESTLDNRTFRSLLLVLSGVPIGILYLWQALVQPLAFGAYLGDFQESYMRAARRLAQGTDPYDLCRTMGCLEPTGPQYVMPPPLAWLLQPLIAVDSHIITVAAILVLNASLFVFLFCALRALRVDDWQLAALLLVVTISFEPVIGNIEEGQINLVLLAFSGVWLWGWVAGRWWGGAAMGLAVAVKMIQAPVGLLILCGRRWSMLVAAIVAGLGLWLLAAPQYLFEYLFSVLPSVSAGTGLFENHSPGGTITRLFAPDTFLGVAHGSPTAARVITLAIAVLALVITFAVLRTPAAGVSGRALEAAAVVAVTPIVTSYSWGTHLVLLLVPILVLVAWGVRRRDWTVLGIVTAGYLLIGPGHNRMQTLLVSGYSDLFVLRLLAELGVLGVLAIWIACLLAVRRERSRPVAESAFRSVSLERGIPHGAER
ncbi:MAG TPA: glycosyltransferase family 87 protein [Candidatus Sulfotelmatobacter sp.]|nr:glycosyltransferase family 87 protein [Candidatus Sulfotelmatobacter sp.]